MFLGILLALLVLQSIWEDYAYGMIYGGLFWGYIDLFFVVSIPYYLIRYSDHHEQDRKVFTIIVFTVVALGAILASADWFNDERAEPAQTGGLILFFVLPFSLVLLGKRRSVQRRVAEFIFFLVVAFSPAIGIGDYRPIFLQFVYFMESAQDILREVGLRVAW